MTDDPTDIKRRYRQFADRECKGYSDLYDGLALFLASIQLLAGPAPLPPAVPQTVWRRGLDAHPISGHADEAIRYTERNSRGCEQPNP